MARREHGPLDDEHVRARLLGLLGALLGVGRHGRSRAVDARCLDRLDSIRDELRLNGFAIHLFEDRVDGSLVRGGYAIDDRLRICISRVDPVEVEHSHTAELAHRDAKSTSTTPSIAAPQIGMFSRKRSPRAKETSTS